MRAKNRLADSEGDTAESCYNCCHYGVAVAVDYEDAVDVVVDAAADDEDEVDDDDEAGSWSHRSRSGQGEGRCL